MSNGWTGGQYSLFRAAFGAYLLVHFASLAPWSAELFSDRGMLPSAATSPLHPLFPSVLFVWDHPAVVTALLLAATALSALLAVGWYDRAAAVALWYVWASLFARNPLIANPGLPYVGWLLLAHACMPARPYGSWGARGATAPGAGWRFPPGIYAAAWVVMAVGYSYSGLAKVTSPSWLDGSALVRVLENPLARPGPLRDLVLALPAPVTSIATWGALALEIAAAPLALFARVRPWLWLALLALHVTLMALLDFADLSLGMVMVHLFTLDPGWITARGRRLTRSGPPVRERLAVASPDL